MRLRGLAASGSQVILEERERAAHDLLRAGLIVQDVESVSPLRMIQEIEHGASGHRGLHEAVDPAVQPGTFEASRRLRAQGF